MMSQSSGPFLLLLPLPPPPLVVLSQEGQQLCYAEMIIQYFEFCSMILLACFVRNAVCNVSGW